MFPKDNVKLCSLPEQNREIAAWKLQAIFVWHAMESLPDASSILRRNALAAVILRMLHTIAYDCELLFYVNMYRVGQDILTLFRGL